MLKIYDASRKNNEPLNCYGGGIDLRDFIVYYRGKYRGVSPRNSYYSKTNYDLTKFVSFKSYLERSLVMERLTINAISYEMLDERCKAIPRTPEAYEEAGLNEEGILLFTSGIKLRYARTDLIQQILIEDSKRGVYLLMPNACFNMVTSDCDGKEIETDWEVLQSQNLGKRLALTKMDRRIF